MAGPRVRGSNRAVDDVMRWRKLIGAGLLCAVLGAALTACSLVKLKQESAVFFASTVLVGRIDCPADWKGHVVVMAYAMADGRARVAHQATLHECGSYELIVPQGDYRLSAFGDANGNGVFDAGEPAGAYAASAAVTAPGTGIVAALDFAITRNPARPALPPAVGAGDARYTYDERIEDGFYCATAIGLLRGMVTFRRRARIRDRRTGGRRGAARENDLRCARRPALWLAD